MKKTLKTLFLVSLCIVCTLPAQGQTHVQGGETDKFWITLDNPTDSKEQVSMRINGNSTDSYDGAGMESINIGSRYGFCTLSDYGENYNNAQAFLIRDTRPYNGYSVDFPLYINIKDAGTYTMSFTVPTSNLAAAFIRLIDKEKPEEIISIEQDKSYSFTIAAGKTGIYADRFIVRVYAGCLFKKGTDGDWNKAENWYGGIPGLDADDKRINNCAIIPEGATVRIPDGSSYQIGALLNSGTVVIGKGAKLEVSHEAKLASVKEIY